MLKLFVHSFGFRFHFRLKPRFDVFAFLDKAAEMGFSGVNLSAFPPDFAYLGGGDARHLRAVRDRAASNDLLIDIECNGTAPDHLERQVAISSALGAGHLRTYTRPAPGGARQQIEDAVRDLASVAPFAERAGIRILVENHEDLSAAEVAEILARVDHPAVGALYDYGNSMLFMEEPLASLEHLGQWVRSAHLKDHVVLPARADGFEEPTVLGVPIGEGHLPIVEATRRLVAAGADRVCFENCWAYRTRFRDRRGPAQLGSGAFAYRHPPYDPAICMPDLPTNPAPGGPTLDEIARSRGLDPLELERNALNRSVDWLRTAFAGTGIVLEREPQARA